MTRLGLSVAALGLCGMAPAQPSFADLAGNPWKYEGRTVRVCGLASNGRERHDIAERKGGAVALGVEWRADEPLFLDQSRCVSGVVARGCDPRRASATPATTEICVGPEWVIQQTVEPER